MVGLYSSKSSLESPFSLLSKANSRALIDRLRRTHTDISESKVSWSFACNARKLWK